MFKDLLYVNIGDVEKYSALLEGKKHVDVKKMKFSSSKSMGTKISVLAAELGNSNEFEGEIRENLLLDFNEFESLLEKKGGDYFFNLDEGDYSLETITKTSIIKFQGSFNIPKEFDTLDIVSQFKPFLISSMNMENQQEEEMFKKIFDKESTKIPLSIHSDKFQDDLGFAKISSTHLLIDFQEIEDYEDEDLTFFVKINSKKKYTNKPIVVFDILKDFFSFGRGLRRQIGDIEIEGIENIKFENNIIELSVLAIYR